ncbi:hypothetical protein GALMADRAFT_245348 [Galerina marginata CBS 339.88]|uniref:Membrane insertase YidC/Oxa/ALB C-terminal domain-containing protein n=1 Tax=Galerina marginata (strain CBS 339.88) TaxID=685588 RepID=A0A067T7B8_GALM3|nr:hypothetical protein GALMADRAFT_245348 [Galerina marginata CBS 339.88]
MVFSSSVSLGIRQGTLRMSSKGLKVTSIRFCLSDTRLFSSTLLPSIRTGRKLNVAQPPVTSRNLSLWGWGSASKTTPPPADEASNAVEETSTSATLTESTPTSVTDSSSPIDASSFLTDTSAAVEGASSSADAEPILSGVTDAIINNVPAALQYGDLAAMGLAGWSPAGLVRWSMEVIHVTAGIPWFWTIVAGSALWRLVCVPLAVKGMQASARMQPYQKELLALQENIKKTTATKDPIEVKKASLMMQEFYKKHNINPLGGVVSLVQLPITLGLFFGVQKLCQLPLEQLKDSGFSLLPDLTVADPTYIMPLALCAMINAQILVGARDINTAERPDMGHFMNVFRILTIPGVFFMASFPSGLLLSLMTTAFLTTVQSLVLRLPAVRRYLDMPVSPPSAQGRLPPILSTFRRGKSWFTDDLNNRVEKARREALERQRAAKRATKRRL